MKGVTVAPENLRRAYQELCKSHQTIVDFRGEGLI
jgi:hypothetical protein